MSQIIDQLNHKQKILEDLIRQEAKRQGRMEEVMKQLSALGLNSIEDAEVELARLLETVSQNEKHLQEIDDELGSIINAAKGVDNVESVSKKE
jgi:ABC-type transporter Mla subunit MlaD